MQSLQSMLPRRWRRPASVILHYHIFKNAGSSIDRLLSESFGARWGSLEGANASDVQSPESVQAFLRTRPDLCAVSSHLARPPVPTPYCHPIILLRHPIDRARSVFQFVRRDPAQPHHHAAMDGFAGFVTWALDHPRAGVPIFDYQVYHLSGASFRSGNATLASTDTDLAQASALIASLAAFGLVRRFAESCALFTARYAALSPALRLRDVRENTSPGTGRTEPEALAAARDELGQNVFTRLWNANQRDAALYDFACGQFSLRIADLADDAPVRRSA